MPTSLGKNLRVKVLFWEKTNTNFIFGRLRNIPQIKANKSTASKVEIVFLVIFSMEEKYNGCPDSQDKLVVANYCRKPANTSGEK